MSVEDNKAIARRFVKEIFEELRPESVEDLVAEDFVWHRPDGGDGDRQFLRDSTTRMGAALTKIGFVVEDEVAEGDHVAIRLTASATARAAFPGIPDAAGRSYSIEEIHIFRLRDGKVVEHWHQYDAMGQRQQLSGEGGNR
jgi:steroid delta-isomerase-like uncharacterized protein